jgi:dipeptidyl aminopeptidase/acylaminoacyl peptidase
MSVQKNKYFIPWESPISEEAVVSESLHISDIHIDGNDVYWIEKRESENGHNTIIKKNKDGDLTDAIPDTFNAKTNVHEYGGGAFSVSNGIVVFSNHPDNRLYKVSEANPLPTPITEDDPRLRYANIEFDNFRNRVITVQEDHTNPQAIINSLVSIDLESPNNMITIKSGADFYSSPSLSPRGTQLAWVEWNHPNMPWDSTTLYIGDISDNGDLLTNKQISGFQNESVSNPIWSPEGILHYISDCSGWWNIFCLKDNREINLTPIKAEFTQPQWQLGINFYDFISKDEIVCTYNQNGIWQLGLLSTSDKQIKQILPQFTEIGRAGIKASKEKFVSILGSYDSGYKLYEYNIKDSQIRQLSSKEDPDIDKAYYSVPQNIEYQTQGSQQSHGIYYKPTNPLHKSSNTLPPLIVITHGGPTAATTGTLNLEVQYWTSRGFAVLDVNYRGSTGYGTHYRKQLNGKWGVYDVEDCIKGAIHLVNKGEVNPNQLIVKGSSAGGYTALAALTFYNIFTAGVSYYGISDLTALAEETHKFESRYLDSMIGKYPEHKQEYEDRSPLFHIDKITSPILLFQGLKDKIVPPNQSQNMANLLIQKGIYNNLITFDNESHGFKEPENIKKCLVEELKFYQYIFNK